MLLLPAIACAAAFASAPQDELDELPVGETLVDELGPDDPKVTTPTLLFASHLPQAVHAKRLRLRVDESGTYRVELRACGFDAYLIVRRGEAIVAEDDDGWVNSHARAVVELEAGIDYIVEACGLDEVFGAIELTAHRGAPRPISVREQTRLAIEDGRACVEFLDEWEGDGLALAFACRRLGETLWRAGELRESRAVLQRALALSEELLGPDHLDTSKVLNLLGRVETDLGNFDGATESYERALEIAIAIWGEEHANVATVLGNLGGTLRLKGDLDGARDALERAIDQFVREFGDGHEYTLIYRNDLAIVLRDLAEYEESAALLELVLQTRAEAGETESIEVFRTLSNLGGALQWLERYDEAEETFEHALAMGEALLGTDHPQWDQTRMNLGVLLCEVGRFDEGLTLLEESVAFHKRAYGPRSPISLNAELEYASVLRRCGNVEESLPLVARIAETAREALGPDNVLVGSCMHEQAVSLELLGQYEEALELSRGALRIAVATYGPVHNQTAYRMSVQAQLLNALGRHEEALPLRERAAAIAEEVLGPDSRETAILVMNLGVCLTNLGEDDAALEAYERALAIAEAAGIDPIAHMTMLASLTRAHHRGGRRAAAWASARAMLDLVSEELARVDSTFAEWERMQFARACRSVVEDALALGDVSRDEADGVRVYDAVLELKGWSTRSLHESRRRMRGGLDDAGRERLAELQVVEAELSALTLRAEGEGGAPRDARLEALRARRAELERALVRGTAQADAVRRVDFEAVRAALPEGSAAVDFLVHPVPQAGVYEPWLVAWITRPDRAAPVRLFLGSAARIDAAVRERLARVRVRSARGVDAEDEADVAPEATRALERLIWDPIAAHLEGAEFVVVAPDGSLSGLPLEILSAPDGSFLVEQYQFVVLADLASLPSVVAATERTEGGGVVAVGGVAYDGAVPVSALAVAGSSNRGARWARWEPLVHAAEESASVAELARETHGDDVALVEFAGDAATESTLKAALPGARYVHLATHGFVAPPGLRSAWEQIGGQSADGWRRTEEERVVGLMPGLLSGLVCAGANRPFEGGLDDGLLTAEEVTWIDLSACELVVLSACQTGLGASRTGEGMMSLQRSFRLAGARSVVSSLWSVDDAGTRRLMESFYRRLWVDGLPVGEALRAAQLEMIAESREKGEAPRPDLWGAFVLSGDWR